MLSQLAAGKSKAHSPTAAGLLRHALSAGILPMLTIGAFLLFALLQPRFISLANLLDVLRQATYVLIVALGQLLVLLTAGIDLSVGSVIALVSVVSSSVISGFGATTPWGEVLAVGCGILAGLATAGVIGAVNGIGVTILKVDPFMMTLGMLSVAFGLALELSGGIPIYGLPISFQKVFCYSRPLGIPSPIYFAAGAAILVYILLNWTPMGRYFYAIGSNARAAHLSGIKVQRYRFSAFVLCSVLAGVAGILLTARILSGEADIGQDLVLKSISACIIGSVALSGGKGRVGNVVLGAIFISLITNGMNLTRVDSYIQQIVLGGILIFAISAGNLTSRRTRS